MPRLTLTSTEANMPRTVSGELLVVGAKPREGVDAPDREVRRTCRLVRPQSRPRVCAGRYLFNALNSGAILSYNNSFVPGGTWLQPITILTGRMAKFSAEFTF